MAEDPSFKPWLPRQPVEAARLQNMQDRPVTTIVVGPGLNIQRKGNSVTITLARGATPWQPPRLRVKVGSTIGAGRYNAKMSLAQVTLTATGDLSDADLGPWPSADDCVVIDPAGAKLAHADALPLRDLVTFGWLTGSDKKTGKPIIEIPPPGVRDWRYNTTTHKVQVAYVSSPASDQWVDKDTATPC